MSLLDTAFSSLSDLKLWFNNRSGTSLKLSDVPQVIPLRWTFFRDNWEFILPTIKSKLNSYIYPDQLSSQIAAFTDFINVQRNNQNKNINPLSNSSTFTTFYTIWDNIEIGSIPLNRQEQDIITARLNTITAFIKTDFQNIRNNLIAARDQIADVTGTEDASYNATYHRSSVSASRSISIKDISTMQTLQDGVKSVDFILANTASLNTTTIDPFALARANANNTDVEIQTGKSGRLVRMFFGDSLQSLAYRYLGDADRWIEIAIANGLRPPYIDEIGEAIPLISNGNGNQINIAQLDGQGNRNREKFYINQVVFLQSNTVKFADQRSIINIREIPVSGDIVLELSGDTNLSQYTTLDMAYVRVYKPNTINSNFMVLIPSTESPTATPSNEVPFFLQSSAEDERQAGVDLAINGDGDLVFTSSGDLQLSFGLANAVQAVQLKMMSEQGQDPRHPTFGLPVIAGTKGNQPDMVRAALVTGINELINSDPRFDRVESLNVTVGSGAANIALVVRLAGSGTLVPISFTVNTG